MRILKCSLHCSNASKELCYKFQGSFHLYAALLAAKKGEKGEKMQCSVVYCFYDSEAHDGQRAFTFIVSLT